MKKPKNYKNTEENLTNYQYYFDTIRIDESIRPEFIESFPDYLQNLQKSLNDKFLFQGDIDKKIREIFSPENVEDIMNNLVKFIDNTVLTSEIIDKIVQRILSSKFKYDYLDILLGLSSERFFKLQLHILDGIDINDYVDKKINFGTISGVNVIDFLNENGLIPEYVIDNLITKHGKNILRLFVNTGFKYDKHKNMYINYLFKNANKLFINYDNIYTTLDTGITPSIIESFRRHRHKLPTNVRNIINSIFLQFGIDQFFDSKEDSSMIIRAGGSVVQTIQRTIDPIIEENEEIIQEDIINNYLLKVNDTDPEFYLKFLEDIDPNKYEGTFKIVLDPSEIYLIRKKINEHRILYRNSILLEDKKEHQDEIDYLIKVITDDEYNNKFNKFLYDFRKEHKLELPFISYFGHKKGKRSLKKGLKKKGLKRSLKKFDK